MADPVRALACWLAALLVRAMSRIGALCADDSRLKKVESSASLYIAIELGVVGSCVGNEGGPSMDCLIGSGRKDFDP